MPAKRHIMHGRDHCPSGADPIPCLPPASPMAGTFEEAVVAIDDLLAYWRLGETGEPFADTSGTSPPADLSIEETGTAPTPNVTGALTTDDDGAIEFNHDGDQTPFEGGGGQELRWAGDLTRFDDLREMTVCAWVKIKASALTRRGAIIGTTAWSGVGGGYQMGWSLQVVYPGRTVRYTRGSPDGVVANEVYATTAGGLVADQWYFLVGTYDHANVRLYVNAVLADETPDTSEAWGNNEPIRIGGGHVGTTASSSTYGWFYGTVDEAAVWPRALTLTEIETLYAAGVEEAAPAGSYVLTSDGTGGGTWGQVTTPAIADEAVTPAKLEPGTDGDTLQTVGGAVVWAPAAGGDPVDDTQVWMPLSTVTGGVPDLVWDGDDQLIPTLTPI